MKYIEFRKMVIVFCYFKIFLENHISDSAIANLILVYNDKQNSSMHVQ